MHGQDVFLFFSHLEHIDRLLLPMRHPHPDLAVPIFFWKWWRKQLEPFIVLCSASGFFPLHFSFPWLTSYVHVWVIFSTSLLCLFSFFSSCWWSVSLLESFFSTKRFLWLLWISRKSFICMYKWTEPRTSIQWKIEIEFSSENSSHPLDFTPFIWAVALACTPKTWLRA